jgi:class 3 adenylate cyclase
MVAAINSALLGDLGSARAAFERIAADDFAGLPQDQQWLVSATTLCEMASLLGDAERGRRLHEMLSPYAGMVAVAGRAAAAWGPVTRYLGLASAAAGEFDRAEDELESSMELSRRMGDRPFGTLASVDLARVLLRRDGSGDRERAMELLDESLETSQDLGMSGLIDDALALKLGASGLDGLDAMTSIGDVADAVTEERPEIRHHAAPDGTVTILFSDIEDSTSMTERLGDERWIGLLRSHNSIFRERLAANSGHEVKNQGDGFMLVFPDPASALRCAAEVQHALAERAAASPDEGIRVRMGMHTGTAIAEEGDFFGRNVILAARIAAAAAGGEVLVSEEAHERTTDAGLPFDEGRELDLKGLSGTHRVFRVIWEDVPLTV